MPISIIGGAARSIGSHDSHTKSMSTSAGPVGFGVWILGFGVCCLVFGVRGLGIGVWSLGFGVCDLGFRVQGGAVFGARGTDLAAREKERCEGTLLIRNRHPLGPYSRPIPRALG